MRIKLTESPAPYDSPVDGSALGSRIRQLRREQGLTQASLGGEQLSESYVSLIESGRRAPSDEALSYIAERLGCTVEVLRSAVDPKDAAHAELLIRRGEWETSSGQAAQAVAHLEEGASLATRLGLPVLVSRGKAGMARALEAQGLLREAIEAWEALLEDSRADPRGTSAVAATVGLSRCYREAGDLKMAIRVADAFWRDAPASASPEDRVVVGSTLLAGYLELGDIVRSAAVADELTALADQIDTPMATAAAYWNAAAAAESEGRVADALRLAERAQVSLAQTDDVRNRARLEVARAAFLLRMRPPRTEEALGLLHNAEPVIEQFGSKVDSCYCQTELARAHLLLDDFKQAAAIATRTMEALQKSEARVERARTLMVRAAANIGLGQKSEAVADAVEAAEMLETLGAERHAASTWTELAELYVVLGETAGAIDAFRKATELFGARPTTGLAGKRSKESRRSRSDRAS